MPQVVGPGLRADDAGRSRADSFVQELLRDSACARLREVEVAEGTEMAIAQFSCLVAFAELGR
eukprot:10249139-Heterocapsa_arctica.AAC.1